MTQVSAIKFVGNYKIQAFHSIGSHQIPIYHGLNTNNSILCSLKKVSVSQKFELSISQNFNFHNDSKKQSISLLNNQVKIVKKLTGSQFLKCSHVLKTKNSIYYVYDHHPKLSLKQVIEFIKDVKVTEQVKEKIKNVFNRGGLLSSIQIYQPQKISIIMQLIQAVDLLLSFGVVHNNFVSQNIFLSGQKNTIDDEEIKISIGGFYQSYEFNKQEQNAQFECKDVRFLGKIIEDLKLFKEDLRQKSNRIQRFNDFIGLISSLKSFSQITMTQIRHRIQKLTTCQFSSVKITQSHSSVDKIQFSKCHLPSNTTSEQNLSFQIQRQNQNIEIAQFDEIFAFNLTKIIDSPIKTSDSIKDMYQNTKPKQKSPTKNILQKIIKCKAVQKVIKIAFKVCIFSIANKEKNLSTYFIKIIENIINYYKFHFSSDDQVTQKVRIFLKNVKQLKKMSPEIAYAEQNILNNNKEKVQNKQNSRIDQETIQSLINKLLKSYLKYQDIKILRNGCLLLIFFQTIDQTESLNMKDKIIQKILQSKENINSMQVQQLKKLLTNSYKTRSNSSSKKESKLLRLKKKFTFN